MARIGPLAASLRLLRALRLAMAPPGSGREAALRRIYMPLVGALARRWQARLLIARGFTLEPVRLGCAAAPRPPVRRLLVLKLDHIGDFVLALPALQRLRDGFPDAHLTLVCARWNADWARRLDWIDAVIEFDFFTELNRDWQGATRAAHDAILTRVSEAYDLAVDLRYDHDTRPCLYRLAARYRAGFHGPPEPGLPYLDLMLPSLEAMPVPGRAAMSLPAEQRLEILVAAVVAAYAPPRPNPLASLSAAPSSGGVRYAVLALGAGDPIRCWPADRFAQVGRALLERHGLAVVVLASAADAADAAAVLALLPQEQARAAVGLTLAAVTDLLAGAAVCVCNGSGVSHIAGALGVPTVALLGGTTRMEVWRPAGPRAMALGGRTPCQPCGLKHAEECPWQVACLLSITPDSVMDAVDGLLAQG